MRINLFFLRNGCFKGRQDKPRPSHVCPCPAHGDRLASLRRARFGWEFQGPLAALLGEKGDLAGLE